VAAFIGSFIVFHFACIRWAISRYPQHNSMAGMDALYYGLPVASVFAVFGFAFAFRQSSRIDAN
jgi:hypothetical protein